MIAQIGDLTPAAVLAWCTAQGGSVTAQDCQNVVSDHMVNGAFCDGDVSMSLDASGNKVVTCTPNGQIEAKINAIKADCLAHCGQSRTPELDAQCVPYCGGGTAYVTPGSVSLSSPAVIAAGIAAALVVGWLLLK